MKKFISPISVLLFSALLLSCSGTKKEITYEDFDVLPDTNDSIYDDDSAETVDDSGEPDEDVNDSDNESDSLSFKTRPHGITKWDETYSYFIRCESEKDLKTVITVSKDDTCKGKLMTFGSLNSNTYIFTPSKKNFPDGRCTIAVDCSDGEKVIKQKTAIQIPNPFVLPGPVDELLDPEILWMNYQLAVFTKDNKLFSINRDLDSTEMLDDDISDKMITYSTDQYLYYISKDLKSILKTDGTPGNTSKMPIPGERKFKSILRITESGSAIFSTQDDISQESSLWFYDHKENTVSLIDLPDEIQNYFSLCDDTGCVFSGLEQPAFLFNLITMTGEQVCSLFSGFNQFDKPLYMNGKLYYRKNYEKCITALEISTCTEEKIGKCTGSSYFAKIKPETGKNYFHIFNYDENKTEITLFSSEGKRVSAVFNEEIRDFMSADGIHLFKFVKGTHKTNDPYKCLKIFDLENATTLIPELMCRPSDVFLQMGFFGETAFLKNLYGKLNTRFFEVNNDATYIEKSMKVKVQPSGYTFAPEFNSGGQDFFTLVTPNFNQVFKTDGTPENTKHVINTFGRIISISDKYILVYLDFDNMFTTNTLNLYSLETNELLFSTPAPSCFETPHPNVTITVSGVYNFNTIIGKLAFFGVWNMSGCGEYQLWTTDGTAEGTVNHEISLRYLKINENVFPDSLNGIYLSLGKIYYLDQNGGNAVDLGLHEYSALGVSDDKFIAYKMESGVVEDIVEFKDGKIIKRMMSSEDRYFTNLSMSEKRIEMLEIVISDKESVTNILYFPDCDITKNPIRTKLFDGSSDAVWDVLHENDVSLYSTVRTGYYSRSMTGAVFNDDGSVTLLEPFLDYYDYDSEYDFTAMTIMGDNFVFNRNNLLRSTPFKNGKTNTVELLETEGFMEYYGNSYSGKAVVEQRSTDYSQKTLITTDSSPENTTSIQLTSNNSDIYLWNGWILENNRYLITEDRENSLNRIDIISGMDEFSAAKSIRNLYFSKKELGLIYRLPETE